MNKSANFPKLQWSRVVGAHTWGKFHPYSDAERVKSSLVYVLHKHAQRHCIWLPVPYVLPFYLPLVVHYCRPLTCENKTHHSLWEFRRCPLAPCYSLPVTPSFVYHLLTTSPIQVGKGGKRQKFFIMISPSSTNSLQNHFALERNTPIRWRHPSVLSQVELI